MFRILTPFILAAAIVHVPATYTQTIEKVEASTVFITAQEEEGVGRCTGFVVQTHLVLTANHCVGEKMTVDGAPVKVVKADAVNDLALLYSDTKKLPLGIRILPVARFEMLTAIGHAYGWADLLALAERVLLISGSVSDDTPRGIIVQPGYIGGMSGGPVVDADGLVVGIVQRGSDAIGYGVDASVILAFVGQ
jgi:S1-C subfamily serine protease